MKKLILLTLLTGCAVFPQHWDPVLYDHYVHAAVGVKEVGTRCDNPGVVKSVGQDVLTTLDGVLIYETYRKDPILANATTLVKKDLAQLVDAYSLPKPPSVMYCQLKLQVIETELDHILDALGGRP